MLKQFALEYWRDGEWYVGRLPEVPGVFSQGSTLDELIENIEDAYHLMVEDATPIIDFDAQRTVVEIDV